MNNVLVVCGPTATGKTNIAVTLAKKFDGEIVSADSRQVYRGMDIGTGKDKEVLQGVPLWMYDVVDPDEPFSVSSYNALATSCIEDIHKRGKLPIIVGGSGLYIQSLLRPLTNLVAPNEALRARLSSYSKEMLQKKLQDVGEDYWKSMNQSDRQNPRRLIRKIEIAMGKKKTTQKKEIMYDVYQIGLTMETTALYSRIDARVEKRVTQGIVDEIRGLLKKGYTWDLPSMSGLGYKQWKGYIEGTMSKEDVIKQWKFDEHGYARRQMTWFRKDKSIHWFHMGTEGVEKEIEQAVSSWYTTFISL